MAEAALPGPVYVNTDYHHTTYHVDKHPNTLNAQSSVFIYIYFALSNKSSIGSMDPNQELCFQCVLLSIEHVPHILWEPFSGYWVNGWYWEYED